MARFFLCATDADADGRTAWTAAVVAAGHDAVWAGADGPAPAPLTPAAGVIALSREAAPRASRLAAQAGITWHHPEAVDACVDRLHLLGRLTASGIATPRFAAVDVDTGEGAERLLGLPAPWRVTAVTDGQRTVVGDLEDLRDLAASWGKTGVRQMCVEPALAGRGWRLAGVLDGGALRVIGIADLHSSQAAGPDAGDTTVVGSTPSHLARDAQAHLAGLVARACTSLGLHQGPITAEAVAVDAAACLVDLAPCPPDPATASLFGIVTPSLDATTLPALLVRAAAGEPLDGYGIDGASRTARVAAHFSGT